MASSTDIVIKKPHKGGQEAFVRSSVDVCIFGGSLGGGKEQSLSAKVLTPDGWVRMGDLKVGDMVCTPFDAPQPVKSLFPQGVKDIYTLKTSDGRTTDCGLEHLWEVRTKKQLHRYKSHRQHKDFMVWTTRQVMDYMVSGRALYIQIPEAQEFAPKDLPREPYLMGAAIIIGGDSPENQYIPEDYLFADIEQRKMLLAGMFDAAGFIDDKGDYAFSTASGRMKDDFIHLCRSLGYIAVAGSRVRDGKTSWHITVLTRDKIFRIERRFENYAEKRTKHSRRFSRLCNHVKIESIAFDRREEAQCLWLDHPDHLYITDDFLTTHNTGGSILAVAEPSLDPRFRAVFLRRTLGELKTAGGIVDEFENMYGDCVTITKSENPRITFKHSGAWIECRQVADENPNKVREAFKGLQADAIFFDELTGFEFYTWNYIMSRCRGTASWTGKIRATTNPSKRHWVRRMLDWYIGADGYVIPERSGVVRYFYLNGNCVDDYVWGDSKEEVYLKCKPAIDKTLRKMGNSTTYEHLIKSFTFILGSLSENTTLLSQNPDYVGSVSGTEGAALLEGNWNVDVDELEDMPIRPAMALAVAENDPAVNSDRWITADLGYEGTDNTVILAWDGFHIIDIEIRPKGTTDSNAEALKRMAKKHGVGDSHIIFDAIGSYSILDKIPEAVPYKSSMKPRGLYANNFDRLKDEVYMRLVEAINSKKFSMSEQVAKAKYEHANIHTALSVLAEFSEECSVVRFESAPSGKKKLMNKKAMNALLGKNRSMDLLDPCAMRFLPCLYCDYGDEISYGIEKEESEEEMAERGRVNIYDDSFWC